MQRRHFIAGLGQGLSAGMLSLGTRNALAKSLPSSWAAIESSVGGRLGVGVLDTATGKTIGHRLDERFPTCSTFKWMASALVLHRVDIGLDQLSRRVHYGADELVPYSPITSKHVAGDGMTMAELCEAAITVSDNGAGNQLLKSFGGPAALTQYARSLGDPMSRFDRVEPFLNEARAGDPRDTSTPRAMCTALRSATLGDALSVDGRAQLIRWMQDSQTGGERLRAGVPPSWRVADKTGTGEHGSTNDVAVMWPPDRAPKVVVAFLTQCEAPAAKRSAALAEVARVMARLAEVSG
jgi:beta-lactamase class A